MKEKNQVTEDVYSEEISLNPSPEFVDYVLLNLRKIKEKRQAVQIPVIGIAGTEGKTTTKRMITTILSRRGNVLETPLDCHSASTVSATLLKLNDSYRYAVLELGIINPEQFKLAVEVAQPNIGVITNIGEGHLANLGDKYLLADAKVELIRNLPKDGFAILNVDDDLVSDMESFSPTPRIIKFGLNQNAHFNASDIQFLGPEGIAFRVNGYYDFRLPVFSITSVLNALAAIAVARVLDFDFQEIRQALETRFQLLPGRGGLINLKDVYLLDYSYTATVNSVGKAIESLVQFKKYSRKLVLILGDLEDAGEKTEAIHRNLGYFISALPIDVVITVGEYARLTGEGIKKINHHSKTIHHCKNVGVLNDLIRHYVEPHTSLLITGRKIMKLGKVVQRFVQQMK